MKKKWLIIGIVALILVIVAIVLFFLLENNNKIFSLESKYYNTGERIEITISDLEKLIDDKESFVVFVSQDMCITSSNFAVVINEFLEKYPIIIYEINYSELKTSNLGDFLEYYPSFVIYKNGSLVDFLDANADEDTNYYKSASDFESWFTSYVSLNEVNKNASFSKNENNTNNVSNEDNLENDSDDEIIEESSLTNLDYIANEEGKVNIYFFWRNGCAYCKEEFAFFDSINEEYGDYYNLYTFEVLNSEENAKLLEIFSGAMEIETRGVPYTIIGEEVFIGFSDSRKEDIISAIENESQNDFDVYFDVIKNQM